MFSSILSLRKWRRRADERINRLGRVRVGGQSYLVPITGGVRVPDSEPWMFETMRCLFKLRAGPFIDVGVNLGQTLLKKVALDARRPYLGFEPNPSCIAYLAKLQAANNLHDHLVLPVGLSVETTITSLLTRPGNDVDASATLVHGFRSDQNTFQKFVPTFSLQDLPGDLIPSGVAIIKIDVEGAELSVIETLQPVLLKDRPYITLELLPNYGGNRPERLARQREIEQLLQTHQYAIFRIRHPEGSLAGIERCPDFGVHSDVEQSDYILCPDELADALDDRFEI